MLDRSGAVVVSLGLMLGVGAATAVHADDYAAYSNTASIITGDISMDDFSISFANGESLDFSTLVSDHFRVDGQRIPASVYRVKRPADPELENGNKLCGAGNVSYIATWGAGEGLTAVAVFTGDVAPQSNEDMCGSYIYSD
jgi:hypothetical protein